MVVVHVLHDTRFGFGLGLVDFIHHGPVEKDLPFGSATRNPQVERRELVTRFEYELDVFKFGPNTGHPLVILHL